MIRKPFMMVDYAKADLIEGVGFEHWGLLHGVVPMLQYMESSGSFWTLWDKEEVVLIGGWYQSWSGVCEVSIFPTTRFIRQPVGAVLHIMKQLRVLRLAYRRIQLSCKKDEVFTDFARRLGFKTEGILRRFRPDGHDHVMMSIIRGDYA